MLNPEIVRFTQSWLTKAEAYSEENVSGCYDKFFTLFVVYNRLYAEATFHLSRLGQIDIESREAFPDTNAGLKYIITFLTPEYIQQRLDAETAAAIETIKSLIESERFHIVLDMRDGSVRRDKDMELLKWLSSENIKHKANGLALLLYSVRCNMFHGNKSYEPVQVELLRPVIIILKFFIRITQDKLMT
ncbi:hypothetical protein [Peredibacter starrii]|uniref:Apea-like HEPN domain-containing protein n=1 Tax=Peredibacter starrii TaxID=28202 RepID=A0AAX4HTV5_9BACT|nr:hypothetical protein [Peredibacter starrii]WPU66656.1 hypothetical protein SOO65_07850 [Peredibacter starrii]